MNSLHHRLRKEKQDYRIVFVPHPVCWTEVPENLKILGRQRRRWSHGLLEVLWRFRGMIANPRYGRMGLLVLPYYVVFELLTPVVEILGLICLPLGLVFGILNWQAAVLYALVAIGYGILLSVVAIAVDDASYKTYRRWKDLGILLVAAFLENFGFRQLHAFWRLRGCGPASGARTRPGVKCRGSVSKGRAAPRRTDPAPTSRDHAFTLVIMHSGA